MASVIKNNTTKGMTYFIQLSPGEHEGRPKISLGKCNKKDAGTAKGYIEKLVRACGTGGAMDTATAKWINRLTPSIRKRLEHLKLLEPLANNKVTVAEWVSKYIKRRPDVKEATRRKWRDVERKLNTFFRKDRLADVTVQQAKAFRVYLQTTVGLAENSIRRQIGISRQFFNDAIDAGVITKNPFKGQPVAVRSNEARFHFVTPEEAQAVLDACPDAEWRLIFGLARFGGLRCPSELLRLKWEDVNFEQDQFTVHASKTEHHSNGGVRTVPMFPELQPLFQDAFDIAKTGQVYCIARSRDNGANLRTHMNRIIKRAGLEPWPKTFQNLRSTRETELFKLTGNIKAVCTWIGNSPDVALKHYAQITEADQREAVKLSVLNSGKKRVQNPVHVVQNPVQIAAALNCKAPHEVEHEMPENLYFCDDKPEKTKARDSMRDTGFLYHMGPLGLEPRTQGL